MFLPRLKPSTLNPPLPQVLPQLQAQFPIERAKMRLKLQVASAATQPLLQMLAGHGASIETCDDTGPVATIITQVGWEGPD
jgi:hypothetical protein